MIRQSYPWKRQLRQLQRKLHRISKRALADDADFSIERPLLLSAVIVRRLLESWKVTDLTKIQLFEVQEFPTLPERADVLSRLLMQGDIEKEFDLQAGVNSQMDAWNISSEIIHSGFLTWEVDERRRFSGIYLASKRNQAKRLLRISLGAYLTMLNAIVRDKVTRSVTELDGNGKLKISLS